MNKDFFKTFLYAGISFGIIMGLFLGITNGIFRGILGGIISGVLFGLIISAFAQIQKNKFKKMESTITKDKKIIMSGGANHFKGIESTGGWLYLTSEEIIFKSHAFNIQTHETVISLNQITEVKTTYTLGFIPSGLQIISNNNIEKFVVNNRKRWVKTINDAIPYLK